MPKLRALALAMLLLASWPAAGGSGVGGAQEALDVRISPSVFDAAAPMRLELDLSFHNGAEGGLGVIDAVVVRPTVGTTLSIDPPSPPTGWFLTRYVHGPAAPLLEFTAGRPLVVGGSITFAVDIDAVDCGSGFAEQPWVVTAYERRAGLTKNALAATPMAACDKLPPVLLSASGDLSIGTDDDHIPLRFDVSDDTRTTGVVTAVDPEGVELQIKVRDGEARFVVPDVDHEVWSYWALFTDAAGNRLRVPSGNDVFSIVIRDTTPPTVDLVIPSSIEAGTPFNISLKSADNVAVTSQSLRWSLDNGPTHVIDGDALSTYEFPPVNDWTSTIAVEWIASDARGNTNSSVATINFVDTTAPVTWGHLVPPTPASGWYTEAPTLTLNASDLGSPRLVLSYAFLDADGEPLSQPTTGAPPLSVRLVDAGRHTIQWNASDDSGNVAAQRTFTIAFDPKRPDAMFTGAPAGWSKHDATLSFTPSAQASGFSVREWRLNDVVQAQDDVTITDEGEHDLTWRLRSGAGLEATGQEKVRIDKTPPVIDVKLTGEGDAATRMFSGDVEILATVTDLLSSPQATLLIDDVPYSPGVPRIVQASGEHVVRVQAADEAGNEASWTASFIIDRAAPTVTVEAIGDGDRIGHIYRSSVELTLASSDVPSGIADITFSLDGGTFQPYADPLLVPEEGPHTLIARARDGAGNLGETRFEFIIDHTPPEITTTLRGPGNATSGTYRDDVVVHIEAHDTVELVRLEFSLDDAPYLAVTDDLVISAEGPHTVRVRATDAAGNVATTRHDVFIDRTPPQAWILLDGSTEGEGFGSAIMLTLGWDAVRDGEAVHVSCVLDGNAIDAAGGVTVAREGDHHASCWAADDAGNEAAETTRVFFVDLSPPTFDAFTDDGATRTVPFRVAPEDRTTVKEVHARIVRDDNTTMPIEIAMQPDGSWQPTREIELSDGDHFLEARAVDAFGHDSDWTRLIGFSLVAYVAPTSLAVTPSSATTREDVLITWTFDEHPVEAWMRVSIDNAPLARMPSPLLIDAEGSHIITLQAWDALGNEGEPTTFAFTIDRTAPEVSDPFQVDVFTSAASWEHTFRASEGGSPATVNVTVNGEASLPHVVLEASGTYAITYMATDDAGNEGPRHTLNVTLDRTRPVVVLHDTFAASPNGFISWDIRDALSPLINVEAHITSPAGVKKLNASVTGGAYRGLEEGTYSLDLKAVDAAGNIGEAHAELIVDLTGPVIRLSHLPIWTKQPVKATLYGDKTAQGVDDARVELRFARGAPETLEVAAFPFTFEIPTTGGDVEITAVARDAAGRVSTLGPQLLVVDVTPPQISVVVQGPSEGPITVSATVMDDKDAFPSLRYQLCMAACDVAASWPAGGIVLTEPTTYRILLVATDHAGHATSHEARVIITAPPIQNDVSAANDTNEPPPETPPQAETPPPASNGPSVNVSTNTTPDNSQEQPPQPVTAPPAPEPEVRSYVVRVTGRADDGTVSDAGLTFTAAKLVGLDIGRGIVRADGNVVTIPAAQLPAGRSVINLEYVWADGRVTRETLEVTRPAPIERSSREPPTVGAATDVPLGMTLPFAALLLAAYAASRRRRT